MKTKGKEGGGKVRGIQEERGGEKQWGKAKRKDREEGRKVACRPAGKKDRKVIESERKSSRDIEKGEGGNEDRKREERHSEKREQQIHRKERRNGGREEERKEGKGGGGKDGKWKEKRMNERKIRKGQVTQKGKGKR